MAEPNHGSESNGSGAKAFGGIMAVFAILSVTLGAIVAINRPMQQRIDHLERSLERIVNKMDAHEKWGREDAGINAAQWERIRSLERSEYGEPITVEHGTPPGGGS